MRVVVINTGTEILLGDVINTHLAFIAQEILPLGLRVAEQITVPDGAGIGRVLANALGEANLVFMTGGLGPTSDDVTREMVSELLHLPLRANEEVLRTIRARLVSRNVPVSDRIPRQADVLEGAQVLANHHGTAPGLYLAANINPAIASPPLFLLPGPPRELRPMFVEIVLPILKKLLPGRPPMEQRTYRMAGMGESIVEKAIGEKLLALPGIELGYCARVGEVDLRVIGDPAVLARADEVIRAALGHSIFSSDKEEIEQVIIRRLIERNETIATAESCTGGLLAHRLTNVAGSSAAFLAGFVTYANEAKTDSLGVPAKLIARDGAVSEAVARRMAEGARARTGATHALATTGIAGPEGGSAEKPVGTVFIGLASEGKNTVVRQFNYPNDRETFKQQTAQTAFDLLRQRLLL